MQCSNLSFIVNISILYFYIRNVNVNLATRLQDINQLSVSGGSCLADTGWFILRDDWSGNEALAGHGELQSPPVSLGPE